MNWCSGHIYFSFPLDSTWVLVPYLRRNFEHPSNNSQAMVCLARPKICHNSAKNGFHQKSFQEQLRVCITIIFYMGVEAVSLKLRPLGPLGPSNWQLLVERWYQRALVWRSGGVWMNSSLRDQLGRKAPVSSPDYLPSTIRFMCKRERESNRTDATISHISEREREMALLTT